MASKKPKRTNLTESSSTGFNTDLELPFPGKSNVKFVNYSIDRFNSAVAVVEQRVNDLQYVLRQAGDQYHEVRNHLQANPHLLQPIPSLQVLGFRDTEEEPVQKVYADPRTGEEYVISTPEGLMKLLRSNLVNSCNVNSMTLPCGGEIFTNIESQLRKLNEESRAAVSLVLFKAFELGAWIAYAERRYDLEQKGLESGQPFSWWICRELGLSQSYVRKLKQVYKELEPYQRLLECSISIRFILTHLRTIVRIMNTNSTEREFWATG